MSKIINQIAGMNFHFVRYPLEHFLDTMAKYSIQNIELWGASPHFYVNDLSLMDIKQVRKKIEQRQLKLICFTPEQCMYPIDIAAKEDYMRERSIRYFERSLIAANELESPKLLVTPGRGYFHEKSSEIWKRSRDSLERLVAHAERLNITMVLEPLTPFGSKVVNDIYSLKKMLNEIDSPYLKGMTDTNHMGVANEDIRDYFNHLGEDLVHIHFIDGPEGHLAWGDGNLPLEHYTQVLKENQYTGYLSLEITSSQYYIEPEKAIEKTMKALGNFLT